MLRGGERKHMRHFAALWSEFHENFGCSSNYQILLDIPIYYVMIIVLTLRFSCRSIGEIYLDLCNSSYNSFYSILLHCLFFSADGVVLGISTGICVVWKFQLFFSSAEKSYCEQSTCGQQLLGSIVCEPIDQTNQK